MVILWYEDRGTIIHRMSPYTKLCLLFWLDLLITLYTRMEFTLPILAIALILAILARIPRSWFYAMFGLNFAAFPLQLWLSLFQANPEFYHHLPPSITQTVIFRITPPNFAIGPFFFGALGLTFGGLYMAIRSQIFGIVAFATICTLVYTVSPTQQVQALAQIGAPSPVLFMLMLPYRFLVVMEKQTERIVAAQTLRGYRVKKSRNPWVMAKQSVPVIMPMIRISVAMIDEVTMAANTRAFGTGKISPIYTFKTPIRELALMAVSTVVGVIAVYLLLVYEIGMV